MMKDVQSYVQKQNPQWNSLQTLANFIGTREKDLTYQQYVAAVAHPDAKLSVDSSRLFLRQSTIDCAVQTFVPKSFQAGLQCLAHQRTLAEHPRQRRMQDSMRPEYYRTHIAKHIYSTVDEREQCGKSGAVMIHQRPLLLLPQNGYLEPVAAGIFDPVFLKKSLTDSSLSSLTARQRLPGRYRHQGCLLRLFRRH